MMNCLFPLQKILKSMSSKKTPMVSQILPFQKKLLFITLAVQENHSDIVRQMKKAIFDDLFTRKNQEFLQECTLLDPRFKSVCLTEQEMFDTCNQLALEASRVNQAVSIKHEPGTSSQPQFPVDPSLPEIVDNSDEVKLDEPVLSESKSPPLTGLVSILGNVIFVREDKPTESRLDRVKHEVNLFRNESLIMLDEDPLKWWKAQQYKFPLLAQVAMKRLCIPATSVLSERVFSTSGDIVTIQRAALSSDI